ncbi:MAG: hypothetical protein ACTS45_02035 [Candidatus Hodgkinia cicadicola]
MESFAGTERGLRLTFVKWRPSVCLHRLLGRGGNETLGGLGEFVQMYV